MADTHVDENALSELRVIMGDDFSLLIDTFISDSINRLDAIESAINAADAEALRTSAHTFKGSALNISANKLTEYCQALESMGQNAELQGAEAIFDSVRSEFEYVKAFLQKL